MDKKYTFAELLNLEWEYNTQNDREDYHLKLIDSSKDKKLGDHIVGTLINFEQCWADHAVASHSIVNEDIDKVASLFQHTKDMFKLLSIIDSPEAKELIKKINEKQLKTVTFE
jgi:hypothetical protein